LKIRSLIEAIEWNSKKLYLRILAIGNIFWKPSKSISYDKVVQLLGKNKDHFFIQVGANDGKTGDALYEVIKKEKWKGILLEPVPYLFNKLIENYKNNTDLIFLNAALDVNNGQAPFYSIKEFDNNGTELSRFGATNALNQLGSFDLNTLMLHSGMHPDFKNLIEVINVNTITFSTLISKYNVKKIDILQIDTEGYDFTLLNEIDFKLLYPQILIFEYIHMTRSEYKKILKKLRKMGYKFYINGYNSIGIKNELFFESF
jgi:FkbM family methyltransferase